MSKLRVYNLVYAVILTVVGICTAVFGGQSTMDKLFGVMFVIVGALIACFALALLVKKSPVEYQLIISAVLPLVFGIALLDKHFSMGVLVQVLLYVLAGIGIATVIDGILRLLKSNVSIRVVLQMVLGALVALFAFLALYVKEFQDSMWIVIGVLIAVYGVFLAVAQLFFVKEKK